MMNHSEQKTSPSKSYNTGVILPLFDAINYFHVCYISSQILTSSSSREVVLEKISFKINQPLAFIFCIHFF